LEHEPSQQFDNLLVDAFSSDAIPVHLLTKEAIALYFRHLKPTGVLAVHISNRYLDLWPVLKSAGDALGKETRALHDTPKEELLSSTTWVMLTGRKAFFQTPLFKEATLPEVPRGFRLWTDDFSNLYAILN
jgi:hypothetical protein